MLSGPEQVQRLKSTLTAWADQLLSGPHDEDYYQLRGRIGRVHVEVGLKQIYMFTAMNVIRESFQQIASRELEHDIPLQQKVTSSLNKLLDLELAVMLETYREEHIARRYRSEQQAALRRLAEIGEMAAMVAHEVRNPLAGISGAIEVLRDDLPPDSPRREVIREMLEQVHRLDERVRDLLIYARRVTLSVEPVNVGDLLRATLSLLSEEPLMRRLRTQVSVPDNVVTHPMDRGQMQEVLVNLIRNAAQAMEGKGDLWLAVERREEGSIAISVEDSGPGVSPERVEEVFKPFVTTWPEGTGLGLSICRKALEAHGGSLSYEPGPRGGARFVAYLPPEAALK